MVKLRNTHAREVASDYHPITALVAPRGREATAPPAAPSDPIPDTSDDIVRAIITPPPRAADEWRYLQDQGESGPVVGLLASMTSAQWSPCRSRLGSLDDFLGEVAHSHRAMPLIGQRSLNNIEQLIEALYPQFCDLRDTVSLVDEPR